jgi:hypothetical protein
MPHSLTNCMASPPSSMNSSARFVPLSHSRIFSIKSLTLLTDINVCSFFGNKHTIRRRAIGSPTESLFYESSVPDTACLLRAIETFYQAHNPVLFARNFKTRRLPSTEPSFVSRSRSRSRSHHYHRLRLGPPRCRPRFVFQPTNSRPPCSRLTSGGILPDRCAPSPSESSQRRQSSTPW